jgi:hypothetical protein
MGSLSDIEEHLDSYLETASHARMAGSGRRFFSKPDAAAQRADHPFFADLGGVVPGHLRPEEVFDASFGQPAGELSVLSLVFPIHDETRAENGVSRGLPSLSWVMTRIYGQESLDRTAQYLCSWFREQGIRAVAASQSDLFAVRDTDEGFPISNWSERHVAYACGLGTFGLSRGLITRRGSAHRVSSFVVEAVFDRYARIRQPWYADCPFLTDGECGECIERCPAGAIARRGQSKSRCRSFCYGTVGKAFEEQLGRPGKGCGLCQTNVLCMSESPQPG